MTLFSHITQTSFILAGVVATLSLASTISAEAKIVTKPTAIDYSLVAPAGDATSIRTIGIQPIPDQTAGIRSILVAQKFSASKSKKRVAKRMRGGLAISPTAAQGDGYPTPGRAFEACGGAGNVFVMYDIDEDGNAYNHSFHCVD
ncbi:MAG: hypothetical protein L3J13_09305 [Devosiaceae bacterium]|nr:hypothetical protein [Devosiaceae bacterium]